MQAKPDESPGQEQGMKSVFKVVSAAISLFGAVGAAQAQGYAGTYHPAAPVYSQAAYSAPVYSAPVYSAPVYTAPAPVAPWNDPMVVAEVRGERQSFQAWVQQQRSDFDRREDREAYAFRRDHRSLKQLHRFNDRQLRQRQDFNFRMSEAQRQSEGRLAARFGDWIYTHSC